MHPLSFVKAMMVLHSACIALLTFSASLEHTFSLRCADVPIAEAQPYLKIRRQEVDRLLPA